MKSTNTLLTMLSVALYFGTMPAFAQHGRPAGVGQAGSVEHGSFGSQGKATASGSAGAQGKSVSDLLSQNTKLSSQISSLTGMPAQQACSGFKNLGQCVAAAHVSRNLGISFDCLKADVTGQAPNSSSSCPASTGSKSTSLGQAIHTLSPNADVKEETKKANKQAQQDMKESGEKS
jgi:hypothetical protein